MIRFLTVFISVCISGMFVGLSGGVEWGTEGCGVLSACTLTIASFIAPITCSRDFKKEFF